MHFNNKRSNEHTGIEHEAQHTRIKQTKQRNTTNTMLKRMHFSNKRSNKHTDIEHEAQHTPH